MLSRARHRLQLGCALLASLAGLGAADALVLARVGALAIERPAFEARARTVAALDWAALGASWPERRRRLLDDVLAADALLALDAEQGPRAGPSARDRALAAALSAELARDAARSQPSASEVDAYRERYRRDLELPRSLALWRILVGSEAEARELLAALEPPSEASFSRLARERSLDHATHMRAGNLGQVYADGDTSVPELRVSPALFAAAERVADGQLVPQPVAEGTRFAVLWRRSSQPARASIDAAPPRIAGRLAEQRLGQDLGALLGALRGERLREFHPERLAEYEPSSAEPPAAPREPLARPEPGPARLAPRATDLGLR